MNDLFSPEPELDPIDTTDPVLQQQAEMDRFFREIQADIALQVLSGADTIVNKFDPNDFRNFPKIFSYLVGIFGKEREVPAQTVINNEEFNIYFASRYGSESEEAEQLAEIKTDIAETAQKQELWEEQILPALEAGGDFVKTAIFGPAPSGGPKSTTAMFEEWMERSLNDLKGPITLTVDPEEGLLLEIMIPVGFEVNGEPLKINIFDEDGNFVGVEEIKEAFFDPDKGVWGRIKDGVFEPILDIFDPDDTDSRTTVERIFDAAESVIVQTGLGGVEQGGWLGEVLGEEARRQLGFNEETNTIEGVEEVSADDLLDGDSDLTEGQTADDIAQQAEEDAFDGMFEAPEEDKISTKEPRGRSIVDKEGNIIGISGDDGNFYVQDEQGNWVVQPEGVDIGGEAELPADTTIEDTGKEETDGSSNLGDDVVSRDPPPELSPEDQDTEFEEVLPTEDQVRTDEEIQGLIDASISDFLTASDLPPDQVRTDEEIQGLINAALSAIPEDTTRSDDEINALITAAIDNLDLPEDTTRTDEEINALIDTALAGLPEDQVRTDEEIQGLIDASISDFLMASDLPEDQVRTDEEIQGLINAALDAIPEDTTRSDDEINALISAAIGNLNLPEDTTRSDEEIQALIDASISSFTTADQVTDIVNDVLVQSGLTQLNDLSDTEVETIVNNIVGSSEDASGLYGLIGDLNDLSEEDVTRIVSTELEGLENISSDDVSNIVTGIIGSPEDASGLYGAISDVSTQVSTLDTDLNNRIDALVDAGVARADAVDQALADLAIANNTTEANILAQIGTTETALRADITDVGASVEALAETVGQDTQYDDQGNVVTESTGIFAEFDNLIDQGANEYQALTTAISNVSDQVGTTEETLFGAIQDSENRLSDIIGSPSVSDDPNTPEDEELPATGIYAEIERSTTRAMAAAAGRGGGPGYMGGLSYQLPGFVGVQYQPKDYTVELDRIINESLFGDMI